MSGCCEDDAPSSEDDASLYEAPEYSPLSAIGSPIAHSFEDEDMSEESDRVSECQQEDMENESSMNTTSEQSQEDEPLWCGYKFVGDNVDKNVKPSRQREEIKGKSLHYFHGYAAKDRVNLASLSECSPPMSTPDPNVLLPSAADVSWRRFASWCHGKNTQIFLDISSICLMYSQFF